MLLGVCIVGVCIVKPKSRPPIISDASKMYCWPRIRHFQSSSETCLLPALMKNSNFWKPDPCLGWTWIPTSFYRCVQYGQHVLKFLLLLEFRNFELLLLTNNLAMLQKVLKIRSKRIKAFGTDIKPCDIAIVSFPIKDLLVQRLERISWFCR